MNIDFSIGLHIVGFLASREGEPVSSTVMAKSFGTSPVVLRRVLSRLNQAELVTTKRGVNGGSVLARDAANINLLQVYDAANENRNLFARHPEGEGAVSRVLGSYINQFYEDAENAMLSHLQATSVADMDALVRPKIMAAFKCK